MPAEINDKHNLDHGDQVLLKMPITIMVSLENGSDVQLLGHMIVVLEVDNGEAW